MSTVVNRLDAIAVESVVIGSLNPTAETGLELVEPEAIDNTISSESIRDISKSGISTPEFIQYVEPLLKPYSTGGYYFRFKWLGRPKLEKTIQKQAKQLGFKSEPIDVEGKAIRVWLNRKYCTTLMYYLYNTSNFCHFDVMNPSARTAGFFSTCCI